MPSNFSFTDGAMTIQRCIDSCREKSYTYAALQSARACFCGDYYYYQQAFDCTLPCDGYNKEVCGNAYTNSVYAVCKRGRYGPACTKPCNQKCKNNVCLQKNGYCPITWLQISKKKNFKKVNDCCGQAVSQEFSNGRQDRKTIGLPKKVVRSFLLFIYIPIFYTYTISPEIFCDPFLFLIVVPHFWIYRLT